MYVLSYIIPVYNGEEYLRETLESVYNQPCKSFEVIIVNDGSSDNSERIVREFETKYDNIQYIKKENSGVASTRNVGLRVAQGEYVLFLDQDDIIYNNSFNAEVEKDLEIYSKEKVDIVAFSSVNSNKDCTRFRINPNGFYFSKNKEHMHTVNLPIHFSFYNRNFLLENNLFFFEKYDRIDTDQQYFHKVYMLAKNIKLRNDIKFYIFRSNFSSVSHSSTSVEQHIQLLDAWYEMYLWNKENNLGGAEFCLGWLNGCFYYALLEGGYRIAGQDYLDKLFDGIKDYENYLFDNTKCASQEYIDGFVLYKRNPKSFLRKARKREFIFNIQLFLKNIKFVSDIYEKRRYPVTKLD